MAQYMLDLYDRTWDGKLLGRNDYAISADEDLHLGRDGAAKTGK